MDVRTGAQSINRHNGIIELSAIQKIARNLFCL